MSNVSEERSAFKRGFARAKRAASSRPAKALYLTAVLIVALPALLFKFPALAGADEAYIVLSGSMVPTFAPGDLIFVERVDTSTLAVGDVVTLKPSQWKDILVTHRITEVQMDTAGNVRYVTRGDANEGNDPGTVSPSSIVGKYAFHLPYWGHLSTVLKTNVGYLFLIVVPGLTIIGVEMLRLYRELDRSEKVRQARGAGVVQFEVVEEVPRG